MRTFRSPRVRAERRGQDAVGPTLLGVAIEEVQMHSRPWYAAHSGWNRDKDACTADVQATAGGPPSQARKRLQFKTLQKGNQKCISDLLRECCGGMDADRRLCKKNTQWGKQLTDPPE